MNYDLSAHIRWFVVLFMCGLAGPVLGLLLKVARVAPPVWLLVLLSNLFVGLTISVSWRGGRFRSWRVTVFGIAMLIGSGLLASTTIRLLRHEPIVAAEWQRNPALLVVGAAWSVSLLAAVHLLAARASRRESAPTCRTPRCAPADTACSD